MEPPTNELRTPKCKHCEGEIVWARTRHGKWAPLEPAPDTDGTFFIFEDGRGARIAMHIGLSDPNVDRAITVKAPRFLSHFDVCPHHWAGEVERLTRELELAQSSLKYSQKFQEYKKAVKSSAPGLRLVKEAG